MTTLTETLKSSLNNPVSSTEFDLHAALDEVLGGAGLTASDSGGCGSSCHLEIQKW